MDMQLLLVIYENVLENDNDSVVDGLVTHPYLLYLRLFCNVNDEWRQLMLIICLANNVIWVNQIAEVCPANVDSNKRFF